MIKKIIKEYIYYIPVVICSIISMLISTIDVYALNNYDNFILPDSAYMFNIKSTTSVDKGQRGYVVDNSLNYEYRLIPFSTQYTYASLGSTLGFSTNTVFQLNHTYTIQIAVATGPGYNTNRFVLGGVQPNLWVTSSDSSGFYNFGKALPLLYKTYQYSEQLINSQDTSIVSVFTLQFKPMYSFNNIVLNVNLNTSGQSTLLFLGYNIVDNGIDNTDILEEQVNQQQQTNDKLDDMNDNITNSNTSDADNKGSSFFDGFSTTDHGGISGIVTAPLTAIKQMLNGTCVPLTTTYKGKELSLPCGYDFWDKMPEIRNFWNLIGGGLLCYCIIVKLFKLIEKMKNPDEDRIEVLEL